MAEKGGKAETHTTAGEQAVTSATISLANEADESVPNAPAAAQKLNEHQADDLVGIVSRR